MAPTFSWTNKADYQINGESAVTFKPGQEITIEITYTLGSTATPNPNEFWFILVGLQDEAMANVDPLTGTWANSFVPAETYPGAGTGGVTTATITVPVDATLNSADPNLTYRVLNYMAYWDGDTPLPRNGGNAIYGGDGASDPTLVYIRSQAEIDALSTKDFQKFSSFYPNPVNDKIYFKNDVLTDSYKVLSVTGALIREVDGSSRSIDVSDLKSGLYFCFSLGMSPGLASANSRSKRCTVRFN